MNQAILELADDRPRANGKPVPRDPCKGKGRGPPAPDNKDELKIDATVAQQKIAYPTALNLLNAARACTEAMIDALGKEQGLKKKLPTHAGVHARAVQPKLIRQHARAGGCLMQKPASA